MQEFMFFIRKLSNSKDALSPEQHQRFLKACEDYIGTLKKEGRLISAQPIEWVGTIVSGPAGAWKDVPFNESKEVIGGYYHIRANSLEEATTIAKANPEFVYNPGTRIEVRAIKTKEDTTGFVYPRE
jgi:hypothetical protein